MIAGQCQQCRDHHELNSLCKQQIQGLRHQTDHLHRAVERHRHQALMDKCHIHITSVG